jgi:hypothetical protein
MKLASFWPHDSGANLKIASGCKSLLAGVAALLVATGAYSSITVEFLQTTIDIQDAELLSSLVCRSGGYPVHLDLSVNWPDKSSDIEKAGRERLIFWDKSDKYLFPKGSYVLRQGSFIIKGYFIAHVTGVQDGVFSIEFEKIDDAQVTQKQGFVEEKKASTKCKV